MAAPTYFPVSDQLLFESQASVTTTDLAVNSNNEAVVVGQLSGTNDVLLQRFNPDGTLKGNTVVLALQDDASSPVVDIAPNGNIVVAYEVTKTQTAGQNQTTITHRDIVVRTFDAQTSELGEQITIGTTNEGGIANGDEFAPDVQIDNNGNIVVVGARRAIDLQDENLTRAPGDIWVIAYDSQGNEISPLQFVTQTTEFESDPQLAIRKSGVTDASNLSAIVSFTTAASSEQGAAQTVSFQPYQGNLGPSFLPIGDNIGISGLVPNSFLQRESSVSMNDQGDYVITWTDTTTGTGEIRNLLVTQDNIVRGNLTQTTDVAEANSSVGIAADGNFVVTYQNQTGGTVEYREFSELAEPTREAQVVAGLQANPSLAINPNGEQMAIAGVTGGGTLGVQAFEELPPPGADFNNDGNSDILWRNRVTGENGVWLMDGVALQQSVSFESQNNPDWRIQGTGDFNDDGVTDFFWRNQVSGENGIWLMAENSTVLNEIVTVETEINTAWYVGGVNDFNGDGEEDLLWRNQDTGANGIWLMNDTNRIGTVDLLAQDNTDWDIFGTGDFNGDGNEDILWRNGTTGDNGVWLMNGTEVLRPESIESQDNPAWYMGGTGDFDSDGSPDILWRNRDTGANGVWIMNGLQRETNVVLDTQTNNDWRMIPTG